MKIQLSNFSAITLGLGLMLVATWGILHAASAYYQFARTDSALKEFSGQWRAEAEVDASWYIFVKANMGLREEGRIEEANESMDQWFRQKDESIRFAFSQDNGPTPMQRKLLERMESVSK